jgi:hypothetical protein
MLTVYRPPLPSPLGTGKARRARVFASIGCDDALGGTSRRTTLAGPVVAFGPPPLANRPCFYPGICRIVGRVGLALVILVAVAACASSSPREEVRQANAAYDAAAAAGAPLLDELAIADRRVAENAARARAQDGEKLTADGFTVLLTFDRAEAANVASIGEPVSVARQRRGLKVVGDYFRVLDVLAEGRNIETAKAQLQVLAGSIAGLATVATGGGAAALAPVVGALGPVIDAAARAENAQELKRLVLEGADDVDQLISALQASGPAMFDVLKAAPRRAFNMLEDPQAQRGELEKIAAYRVAVANYVVLLEQLRTTLKALVAAVRTPNSGATLGSLSAASTDLLLQAEAARRAYAALRQPAAGGG